MANWARVVFSLIVLILIGAAWVLQFIKEDGAVFWATLGLAVVTLSLAVEAQVDRGEALAVRSRRLTQSALAEMVENLRVFRDFFDDPHEEGRHFEAALSAFSAYLVEVRMPADLWAYLMWARGYLRHLLDRHNQTYANRNTYADQERVEVLQARSLELMLVVIGLMRLHVSKTPALRPIGDSIPVTAWEEPFRKNERFFEWWQDDMFRFGGAPRFPHGFETVKPEQYPDDERDAMGRKRPEEESENRVVGP